MTKIAITYSNLKSNITIIYQVFKIFDINRFTIKILLLITDQNDVHHQYALCIFIMHISLIYTTHLHIKSLIKKLMKLISVI